MHDVRSGLLHYHVFFVMDLAHFLERCDDLIPVDVAGEQVDESVCATDIAAVVLEVHALDFVTEDLDPMLGVAGCEDVAGIEIERDVLVFVGVGAGPMFMIPATFLAVASVGPILGNASALAIRQVPEAAGTGSAVLGAAQFGLGAIASPLVGLLGENSPLPMALVMVVAGLAAVASFSFLTKEQVQKYEADASYTGCCDRRTDFFNNAIM